MWFGNMWIRITFYLVIHYVVQISTLHDTGCYKLKAEDVCKSSKENIPHIGSRSPDWMITKELHEWCFCDVFAINTGQWYRSTRNMTENRPEMYMCGTKFPIWLKRGNPNLREGLVNRTACLKAYDEDCLREYSVVAVNCGKFMAYCFNELPSGCYQRYCFGESKKNTSRTTFSDTSHHRGRRVKKRKRRKFQCPINK